MVVVSVGVVSVVSVGVVVSVVSVSVDSVVVGSVVRVRREGRRFRGERRGRVAAAVVAGDDDDRDDEADDHGDQPGDHQPHVAVGLVVRILGLAHHPGRVVVHLLYSSGPSIASRISLVSSISNPSRRRVSISSRLLPETAIWVASRRAAAEPPLVAAGAAPAALSGAGGGLDGAQPRRLAAAGALAFEPVRLLAQPLGDDAVGPCPGLLEVALRLLLGVVDDAERGPLGGVDDRGEALGDLARPAVALAGASWRPSGPVA